MRYALCFLLALAGAACTADTASETPQPTEADTSRAEGSEVEPATLASFDDGQWQLLADRAWDAANATTAVPSAPLDERDYQPMRAPIAHAVVVENGGAAVRVGDEPVVGKRAQVSATEITYDLTEGTFAGGRFVVRQTPAGLQAELTIYGSGRPIVESHRGALTPVR